MHYVIALFSKQKNKKWLKNKTLEIYTIDARHGSFESSRRDLSNEPGLELIGGRVHDAPLYTSFNDTLAQIIMLHWNGNVPMPDIHGYVFHPHTFLFRIHVPTHSFLVSMVSRSTHTHTFLSLQSCLNISLTSKLTVHRLISTRWSCDCVLLGNKACIDGNGCSFMGTLCFC